MRLEPLIMSTLFIVAIMAGLYGVFISIGDGLGTSVDTSYVESFNKTQDSLDTINSSFTTITQENLNPVQFVTDVVLGWRIIKEIVTLPIEVAEQLFIGTDTEPGIFVTLGIPPWAISLILGGLTIMILFAMIALLFGRRA